MDHGEVVIRVGDRDVVVGRVSGPHPCSLALVDDLALLQRAARRLGWTVHLRDVSGQLRDLLDLAGLAEVLPADPPGPPR